MFWKGVGVDVGGAYEGTRFLCVRVVDDVTVVVPVLLHPFPVLSPEQLNVLE